MPGGKGKSTGGKAGPKEVAGKSQKSHSAKAGLQVWTLFPSGRLYAGSETGYGWLLLWTRYLAEASISYQ